MDICTARRHALAQAKYRTTPKGRAAEARYNRSPKGHARNLRYRATERGNLMRRLHDTGPEVLLRKRLYMQEHPKC